MTDVRNTKISLIEDINKAKLLMEDKQISGDDFDNFYEMTVFELEHILYELDRSIAFSRKELNTLL